MGKILRSKAIVLVFAVVFSLSTYSTISPPSPSASTVLRFDPASVELGPDYCVNDTFTLKARVDNVEDLAAFGLQIKWNTTYLDYVDHIVKVPVETYSDGLLHEPILVIVDKVNASKGTYDVAVSILVGPTFYGSGIAFEITFSVKYQPAYQEPDVNFMVKFTLEDLAPSACGGIPHFTENSNVTIYPYWNPADVNDDLKVDIFDLVLGANAYLATPSDSHWNPRCDIANPYDVINIFDIVMIALSYGEEYVS